MTNPQTPRPISVQVSGSVIKGLVVTLTNNTTGERLTEVTSVSGQVVFDAANFASGYTDGDQVTASVTAFQTDFSLELWDQDQTGLQVFRRRSTSGKGTYVLTNMQMAFKSRMKVMVQNADVDGDYKFHLLYEG